MTYEMDIAGLKRDLPLCKVSDDLYIGAFVMFGDVELIRRIIDRRGDIKRFLAYFAHIFFLFSARSE